MITLNQCPICSNTEYKEFITVKDYTVSKKEFIIVECKGCGFKYTNPRPAENSLGKYYESEEYVSHSDTRNGMINVLYHFIRTYTIKKKIKLLRKYSKGDILLDIGCGTGAFLSVAERASYKTIGIEPDENARSYGKELYGLGIFDENKLKEIKTKSTDIITMWHVLEHVSDLTERITTIERILKDDGVLFVAVPNCSSWDAKYYKQYWAAYDVPRHLYHFSPKDIKALFTKVKLEVVKTLPMKFDSFYVSMLSEKYKNGRGNLLMAFMVGLISNMMAKRGTYSSQIYILRKK